MASGDNEWFADESIWKDLYPFTFPESAFAVGDEQVEKILRLTGISGARCSISVVVRGGIWWRSRSGVLP
jgi:hypothetical protein